MTIRRSDDGYRVLDGVCAVEDAESLLQMLQATPACDSRLDTMSPTAHGRTPGHHGFGQWPDWTLRRRLGAAMAGAKTAPKGDRRDSDPCVAAILEQLGNPAIYPLATRG